MQPVLLYGAETWPLTEPSPPGLTALTVGLSDRFLAFTGATSFPMKRCVPLPDSPRPPLWLPAAGSAGMDMCFACHRTILLGLSWTSTLARSAGSDPEEPHAPVGSTWSNAILTSSASIHTASEISGFFPLNGVVHRFHSKHEIHFPREVESVFHLQQILFSTNSGFRIPLQLVEIRRLRPLAKIVSLT